jgi:uncharacterized SAM-binding protein YcdF (DUF218 family)
VRRRKILLILSASVLIVCWVCFAPLLAKRLIIEHPLEKADIIVVLSGSAAYKDRTRLAAALYTQGNTQQIVISDDGGRAGWSQAEETNLPFVELARRELVQDGVSNDAITQLPGTMNGTDSEAKAVAAFVAERQTHSVLLVTSPYHTRRAFDTFNKALSGKTIDLGIVPTAIGASSPPAETWWLRPTGWRDVAGEYVKSLVYWLFY